MCALLAPHSLLGRSPRASGKYRAGADFSDYKAMSARVGPQGAAAERLGLTQVPGLWAEELDVPVPAYRRMDTLPTSRMSRGHFSLLKRCSPLRAGEARVGTFFAFVF